MRNAVFCLVFFCSVLARAEGESTAPVEATEPAAVTAAAPAPSKWFERIKVEGLAEGYFSYRFQGTPADATNELRAFDNLHNKFTPSFGKLAFSLAPEPAGFRIDLAFGPTADIGAPDLGSPGAEVFKHILQAYASVKLFDKVTVDFGKFVTNAGAEIFENSGNWLFSRTMIFTYGPYTHAGARASIPFGDFLTVQASVVNGWDNVITGGIWKTFGLSAFLTLPTNTSIALNFYGGPQSTPEVRYLFDLVATQKVGDAFAVNFNGIYGMEGASKWFAGALMAKYTIAERVRISARVEYFGDPDGHRTTFVGSSYLNSTLGVGVILTNPDAFGTVEIRPEFRHDMQLGGGITPYVGGTSASQTTAQIAMVAWF
jgi:hypothetical protein